MTDENPDAPQDAASMVAAVLAQTRALTRQGQFDAAADLLFEHVAQHGRIFEFLTELCLIDFYRRDHPAAFDALESLRARFPKDSDGYSYAAMVHFARGELVAGVAMFGQALAHSDLTAALALAQWQRAAANDADPAPIEAAIALLGDLQGTPERLPTPPDLFAHAARLEAAGQPEAAAALRAAAAPLVQEYANALIAAARGAEQARDPALALRHWTEAAGLVAPQPQIAIHRAHNLLALGQLAAAEAVIAEGLSRFDYEAHLLRLDAMIATRRGDWAEARRRWHLVRELHPGLVELRDGIGDARMARRLAVLDGSATDDPAEEPDAPLHAEADLLARCVSLGQNREFGVVQRLAGIEPLDLLRWADTSPQLLVGMLKSGLEGVGDPANCFAYRHPLGEVHAGDRRYFDMHTFLYGEPAALDALRAVALRRLQVLADRLRAALADAGRIFVFVNAEGAMPPALLDDLAAAIRRFGAARLLCVDAAAGEADPREVQPGIFLAHLPGLATEAERTETRLTAWLALCRAVAAA